MKKVLVICPYPEGVAPSQRLKYEQYFNAFRQHGYQITVSPFIERSFWQIIYKKGYLFKKVVYTAKGYLRRIRDLYRLRRYDLVYIHLWGTPIGFPVYEYLLSLLAKKMIYDIDDLVYLKNTKSKAHPVVTYIKGRKKPLLLMKKADHVITCTPYLDEFVRRYNVNTTDISSTVNTDRYLPVNNYTNDHKLTIGWSGSLSTAKYFKLLENVFKRLQARYSFSILVMGDPSIQIEGLELKAQAWSEEHEIATLQKFDIGVYPLPEEEWVLGKSGLKAIQYMALGIPTVATAIGANYRVIDDGESGFLVKTEDEWVERLSQLLEQPLLRQSMGAAARQKVLQQFSLVANLPVYLNVFQTVLFNQIKK